MESLLVESTSKYRAFDTATEVVKVSGAFFFEDNLL